MKKLFYLIPVLIIFLIVTGLQLPDRNHIINSEDPEEGLSLDFPEDVTTILERSCFDCHTDASGNFMAKGKLNFSNWSDYDSRKKISKLNKICEEIEDESMPKKKYRKKHPEKALSEDDIKLICKWVEEESEKIIGD